MKLGTHLSIQGSIDKSVDRAVESGCSTFQMFSGSPRRWTPRELEQREIERFRIKLERSEISPVFIHTPYLLNLASPRRSVYIKSIEALKNEMRKAARLNVLYLVTHLGSHLGHGRAEGVTRIVDALNLSVSEEDGNIDILLENTAGSANSIGSRFGELGSILSRMDDQTRIGVCFDTCHAYASGYDLVSKDAVERSLSRLDGSVGLDRVKLVHLNDSKGGLGSRIDRHEHIGLGRIGEEGFRNILESPLGSLPLILETPRDVRRSDRDNLMKVRELSRSQQ